MRNYRSRAARLGALATVAVVVLSACGGGSIEEQTEANEEAASDAGGDSKDADDAEGKTA